MNKHAEKVCQNLVADPLLIMINSPKYPVYARKSFARYFESGSSKILTKYTFFLKIQALFVDITMPINRVLEVAKKMRRGVAYCLLKKMQESSMVFTYTQTRLIWASLLIST